MNIAIIMAAGSGKRMNSGTPKQFLDAGGKPVIIHTLEKFQNCAAVDAIIIVCAPDYIEHCTSLAEKWGISKCVSVVAGGAERYDSSRLGVKEALRIAKGRKKDTVVLIHDAARPFVTEEIINANAEAARKFGACETAIRMTDTVVCGSNGFAEGTIPRENLYRVQTPQSFRLDLIANAFESYDPKTDGPLTDDASLFLRNGSKVAIVEGSALNVKITTPEDMELFGV